MKSKFVIFFSLITFMESKALSNYPVSDHFDGKHFFNEKPLARKGFMSFLRWTIEGGRQKWPSSVENKIRPELVKNPDPQKIYVTFINHASFLIQINGVNILTDPIFSERASPFSWVGPKRVRPPALRVEELPQIHYVIVSHNHYDHMDLPSLKALSERFHPRFLVPLANAKLLNKEGIDTVTELDWWQSHSLGDKGNIELVPCQHWSARGLFDRLEALWGAYVISADTRKILFVGDAGYSSIYKKIYKTYGPLTLSILPIGAYEPRWFMKDFHMNPEEAVQVHLELHSLQSIGSHFGTFQLTNEAIDAPPKALEESMNQHGLPREQFLVPEVGQTFVIGAKQDQ